MVKATKSSFAKRLIAIAFVCTLLVSVFAVPVSAASWGSWKLTYSNSNTSTGDKDNNNNSSVSYDAGGDLTSIRAATYGSGFWGSRNCTANSNKYVIVSVGRSASIPTNVKTEGYSKAFISFSSTASGVSGYCSGTYSLG